MDAAGRMITIIFAVIIIILLPIWYISQAQGEKADNITQCVAKEFVDTVRHKGYITKDMYYDFLDKTGKIGNLFDITMKVSRMVSNTEVASVVTADKYEKLLYLSTESHNHSNSCYAGASQNTIPVCDKVVTSIVALSPIQTVTEGDSINNYVNATLLDGHTEIVGCTVSGYDNSKIGTQTVTLTYSGLVDNAKTSGTKTCSVSVTVMANHVHTDDCYAGVKHIHTGSSSSGGGCYGKVVSSTTGRCEGYYHFFSDYVSNYDFKGRYGDGKIYMCDRCGKTLYVDWHYPVNTGAIFEGIQCDNNVTKTLYEMNCGKTEGIYYNSTGNPCSPICDKVVTSIIPVNPNQAVIKGRSIDTSAIATYLDGHNDTVSCTTSGFDNTKVGIQTVTLIYTGLVDNGRTTGTKTCTISVYVVDAPGNHNHTDDCYAGTKHIHTTVGGACYGSPEYTYCGAAFVKSIGPYEAQQSINLGWGKIEYITDNYYTCTYTCGHVVNCVFNHLDYIYDSSLNQMTWISNWSKNISFTCPAVAYTTAPLICDKTEGYYYDSAGNLCSPICSQVVMGITAVSPIQTVSIGENVNTAVNVLMLDGSTKTMNCAVSGFDKYKIGKQVVTLIYSGLVNNAKTSGLKTCAILVTVTDKILMNITVDPGDITVQRYAELEKLPFVVTAYYKTGESKVLTSGYTVKGYNNTLLGKHTVTISYTQGTDTKTANVMVTVTHLMTTCPICGYTYELDDNDIDQGCPYCAELITDISATPDELTINKGDPLTVTVTANYVNGKSDILTGWDSNYNPNQIGEQSVKITYRDFYTYVQVTVKNTALCPICGTEYDLNEDGSDPGCSKCSTEVVSISVEPKDLKVMRNSKLNLTVTAAYKDGHKAIITGWYTEFYPDAIGAYQAMIHYKKASEQINVTVYDNIMKCPYCGLEYEYSESPGGCPLCSKTIVRIEAALRDGGTKVIYGSQPNIQITLIYKDTHKEKIYTGWTINGYRPDILGEQMVKVNYITFSTSLTLEVIKNPFLVTCPICGTQYYHNEDGTDPGCPSCTAVADDENIDKYFDVIYTDEIVQAIFKDGNYQLKKGDCFTVKILIRNTTLFEKIRTFFDGMREDIRKKEYVWGGEVDT